MTKIDTISDPNKPTVRYYMVNWSAYNKGFKRRGSLCCGLMKWQQENFNGRITITLPSIDLRSPSSPVPANCV